MSTPSVTSEERQDLPATNDDQAWGWTTTKNVFQRTYPAPLSTPPTTSPKAATTSQAASGSHLNIAQRVLSGKHHNATFEGTSQYARGGSSACGLASMNAIRLAFDLCAKLRDPEALISALVSEKYVQDAMAIAASWPDEIHLEVEPILQPPLFASSLRLLGTRYGAVRYSTFSDAVVALKTALGPPGPRAVFLTRPPEMIGIMHIPIPATTSRYQTKSIFLIFDSHPRLDHPNGAAVQILPSASTDDVVNYLMHLFQIDDTLLHEPNLQWQAQLLGQVSYHLLAPVVTRDIESEYALNMQFLTLHHRFEEAERKLTDGEKEKRSLRSKIFDLEQKVALLTFTERRTNEEIQQLKSQPRQDPVRLPNSGWLSGQRQEGPVDKGKRRDDTHSRHTNTISSGGEAGGFDFSSWGQPPMRSRALPNTLPKPSHSRIAPSTSSNTPGPSNWRKVEPRAGDAEAKESLELAMALQRQFDEEHEAPALDESLPQTVEPPKFDCGICMESSTDEAIARVDGCNHLCCRDCMRTHIQSRIEERRYPIPCPFCAISSDNTHSAGTDAGFIPSTLVETIGVSPELYDIYTEMELTKHSIKVDCRSCSQSAFIDRADYESAQFISCPMPQCCHTWCKQCNQTIVGGAKHSCDGSAEFETLINQQGWKQCPGCRIPIEKRDGCNHIACKTPGCNTHFCYKCDAVIFTGGTTTEMVAAKVKHFRTCTLY